MSSSAHPADTPASVSASAPAAWHRAWSDAQPRFAQIHQALAGTATPSPRIIRVGQVDAELLDQELVQLLKEPLVKALAQVNSAWKSRHDPELTLLIELVLYKFSVWNQGASFGAKLQGLKYEVPRELKDSYLPVTVCGLPRRTLLIHSVLTLILPYVHTRVRAYALSNAWPDAPSSDRRRKAWRILSHLESMHALIGLLNFIAFLWDGRYRTSVDRLLGMRLVSARRIAVRDVSYEFMNRQMVWHAFTEFLLFLLPLVNTRALRRRLVSFISHLSLSSILPAPLRSRLGLAGDSKGSTQKQRGKYYSLPLDQCAICADNASPNFSDPTNALNELSAIPVSTSTSTPSGAPRQTTDAGDEPPPYPIHTPYVTSCGHVYCYYCLTERMMRTADECTGLGAGGTQWACLRCGEGVVGAERVEAQVEGPNYESGVEDEELDYEYGSEDLEFTDISGSVGTYSESGMSEYGMSE